MENIEIYGLIIGSVTQQKSYGKDGFYLESYLVRMHYAGDDEDFFIFEDGILRGSCISLAREAKITDAYRECLMLKEIDLESFLKKVLIAYTDNFCD